MLELNIALKFLILSVLCQERREAKGNISDKWMQRIPQRKGKRCSYWVIAFDYIKVIHEVCKKQIYQGVKNMYSSFL